MKTAKTISVLFAVFMVVLNGAVFAEAQEPQIPSPKQQMKNGVDLNDIVCNSGLSLMIKFSTTTSVCVKPSTALKLNERSWGSVLKDSDEMEIQRQSFLEDKQTAIELEPAIEQTLPAEEETKVISDQVMGQTYDPKINPEEFVSTIDNPYFTLIPGTTFLYESDTEDGEERIEVTVTNEKRDVLGVETTVVWDRVWLEGQLIEDTKDWYAQDNKGNVWYFGEISKEYEDGEFIGTSGSWEAGVDGAKPGILMKASPQVGDVYRQEYYKDVAEDMGEVVELNVKLKIDYAFFSNCLKTKDWTALEPDVIEYKYYCMKINNVVMEENVEDNEVVMIVDVGSDDLVTDITLDEAKKIALEEVPGVVTDFDTEGFRGNAAYAIEILADNGVETDVFVDMKTGEVLGIET